MAQDDDYYCNFRRPSGVVGKGVLSEMNAHHRGLTEWAVSLLGGLSPKEILDIGCGGGMAIRLMSDVFPEARLCGIDHSPESVGISMATNADLLQEGRCDIVKASVSSLPFLDGRFDLITAFETYFFWPDLENDLAESIRVLSPGGTILIVSETYPHEDFDERNRRNIELCDMNVLENDEMVRLLRSLGVEAEAHVIENENWVAFLGKKKG